MKDLIFSKSDLLFLKKRYTDLFKLLSEKKPLLDKDDGYHYVLRDRDELKDIELAFISEIASSLNDGTSGLDRDGIELEKIWDKA